MNCAQSQNLLQQRLDGLAPPDAEQLDLHLQTCPACRALESAVSQLQFGLRLLTPPCPPRRLAGQVASCLLEDHRRRQHRKRHLLAWGSLAAAVLIGLNLASHLLGPIVPTEKTLPDPVKAMVKNVSPKDTDEPAEAATSQESATEIDFAMARAASHTADATVAQARNLLPLALRSTLPDLQAPPASLEPPVRSLQQAGQGITNGLSPVANSARRAVDLFWRDLSSINPDKEMGL